MKVEELYAKYDSMLGDVPCVVVPNEEAWKDESGEPAWKDGSSVQLDCEDEEYRRKVFTSSVFRYLRKNNLLQDVVKDVSDLDFMNEDCKLLCRHVGGIFPDYVFYTRADADKYDKILSELDAAQKNAWKTDAELYEDCVRTTAREIEFDDFRRFIHEFDRNEFGFKYDDVRADPVANGWLASELLKRLDATSREHGGCEWN